MGGFALLTPPAALLFTLFMQYAASDWTLFYCCALKSCDCCSANAPSSHQPPKPVLPVGWRLEIWLGSFTSVQQQEFSAKRAAVSKPEGQAGAQVTLPSSASF